MNVAAALLAPILMLVSAIGGNEETAAEPGVADAPANAFPEPIDVQDAPEWPIGVIRTFQPIVLSQVHIEQRMTIRISPRAAVPVRRDMLAVMPQQATGPRFSERKIGKCLPMSGIVGVEPNGSSNLILFMRDRRMINAALDRSCRAHTFYSGFYLSPSDDGMICVDRDTLHSRSGTACKLSSIRQLIEIDE